MELAGGQAAASARSRNQAASSAVRSRAKRPTICTPSGKPRESNDPGTLMQGGPSSVHSRLNMGSPVEPSPSGAAPGARGGACHKVGEHRAGGARGAAGLVVAVKIDRRPPRELMAQDRPEPVLMMI